MIVPIRPDSTALTAQQMCQVAGSRIGTNLILVPIYDSANPKPQNPEPGLPSWHQPAATSSFPTACRPLGSEQARTLRSLLFFLVVLLQRPNPTPPTRPLPTATPSVGCSRTLRPSSPTLPTPPQTQNPVSRPSVPLLTSLCAIPSLVAFRASLSSCKCLAAGLNSDYNCCKSAVSTDPGHAKIS